MKRCAYCRNPVDETGALSFVLEGNGSGRRASPGYRSQAPSRNYWHASCLDAFEELNSQSRERNARELKETLEAAGIESS